MIEFITGILTIPFVFWTLFLAEIVWLIWAVEEESAVGSIWALIFMSFIGILKFGSFGTFYAFIKANPVILVIGFCAYMAIGTFWALFKWYLFVGKKASDLKELILKKGKNYVANYYTVYEYGEKNTQEILDSNFAILAPKVNEYKSKVTFWIMFWVPSAFFFFLNDPIRRCANWIFDHVKNIFQSISNKAFSIDKEI